ncbi:MAG: alpha/beta hydrolase [Prochlorothrix sp.]
MTDRIDFTLSFLSRLGMRSPVLGWFLILGAVVAGAYGALALWIGLTQGQHIFFPEREWKEKPEDRGYAYETLKIPVPRTTERDKSANLHGWWVPHPSRSGQPQTAPGPVVLFFHGNTGTLADNLHRVAGFHQLGLDVVLFDYRGYGHSTPTPPREDWVYADADAVVEYLVQQRQVDPRQMLVYGHSLGGAIAVDMAARSPYCFAGLVVEGSFTSMLAMAHFAQKFTYLPLSWVLWQRFDTLAKVPQLRIPVLFVHGTADRTVPAEMSERLYHAAPEPKSLALIPEVDHDITASPRGEDRQILGEFIGQHLETSLHCRGQGEQRSHAPQ